MNQQPNGNGYPYAQQPSPYPVQPQGHYGQQGSQPPLYAGQPGQPRMQQPVTPPPYAPQQSVQRGYAVPQGYPQQVTPQQGYPQGGVPQQNFPQQGYPQGGMQQHSGMQPQAFPQGNTQPQAYPPQQLQPGYTTQPQPKVYPYPQQPAPSKGSNTVSGFLGSIWDMIQERGLLLPVIALALGAAYALYITIVFFTSYQMNIRVLPHLLCVWASVAVNGAACMVQKRTYVTVGAGVGYLVAMLLFLNQFFLLIPSIVLCAFDYFFPQQRS